MNKSIIILLVFSLLACSEKQSPKKPLPPKTETAQTPAQLGKEIFEGKGNCIACHQPKQKIVGPSIEQIAQTYKDKSASIVSFLKEESEPLVNPDQYEVMKTNFAITKAMSDEELNALEAYIYSNSK